MPEQPSRTLSDDSTLSDATRKRVCKACDRCRLKKSKCDGSNPCSRCKADNAICAFGERKKSHDKVYPKGYVEMLEQQQSQLVAGLQEMYHRMLRGQSWNGPELSEASGHPLTHDILAALHLLETKEDNSGEFERFEEDCQNLQAKLLARGAPYVQRRGSFSSDSEHSLPGHNQTASDPTQDAHQKTTTRDALGFTPSPSPLSQSPLPQQRTSFSPIQSPAAFASPSVIADPQFYQSPWVRPDLSTPQALMRSKFAMQTPDLDDGLLSNADFMDAAWDNSTLGLDIYDLTTYPPHFFTGVNGGTNALDPMELDLSKAVPVVT